MSSAGEPGSPVAEVEVAAVESRDEVVSAERRVPSRRYTRDELLEVKGHPDCQKLPAGLEPDDLSDLMESVFFDKNTMFDRSPTGDIYLGPQRGPPPGLRPAFGGPRRTGFAPGALHSRLVDDGRSLSPERDRFQRVPSSGLTTAFAVSPGKAPMLGGVRPRFDDASKMDRWDSNKVPGGGGEEDWTPRGGRAARGSIDSWRAGGGGGEPGTPGGGGAPGLGTRHSLERASSGWGGREAPVAGGERELRRGPSGVGSAKDAGGRWAKDDPDDWRARKQAGAVPEPRYDWADRTAPAAPGAAREPPPGFGAAPNRRGMPEWADEGEQPHRGPVTAADIEAERQRMQKQWKAQREERQRAAHGGGGGEEEDDERGRQAERGAVHRRDHQGDSNTFLGEVMGDDDFESWARAEKAKQEEEDRADAQRQQHQAAAPKAGQQIDVKALFGGGAGAGPAAAAPQQADKAAAGSEPGEPGVRSRFANFFKLDEGAGAPGAQQPGPMAGAQAGPPGMPAHAGEGNAGTMLLAMLKKQLPGNQQPGEAGAGGLAALVGGGAPPASTATAAPAASLELDDVTQVAMSAALQGLDEAVGEEERMGQQAAAAAAVPRQQQAQQQVPAAAPPPQTGLPPYLQAQQQQQQAAMLAALGSRPLPQQAMQRPMGQPPQAQGMGGMVGGPGGMPGGMPGMLPPQQQASPGPGYPPGMQYNPAMQYGGVQPQQYGGAYPQAGLPQQYRPPVNANAALLQQQAQQNALLAQLLAAQQRQQQQAAAQAQAQRMLQLQQQQAAAQAPQQQGQFNLAALLAAAGGGGGGVGMQPQGINAAHLMGQQRIPGMMPPNLGQAQQPSAPSAQLQLLQQLQMAAAAAGGGQGGLPGAAPGMGGNPVMQQGAQPGGGMTAAQQQQLLGMLRMSSGRQQQ